MVMLATEFADLAAAIHGDSENAAALQRLVELAVKHIPGCMSASITAIQHGKGLSMATSDAVAAAVDALQHSLGQGPCMEAASEDANCLLFDVEHESRWSQFVARASRDTPVRCVLAIRLAGPEQAALNLYAMQPAAFDDDAIAAATLFAAQATGLVAHGAAESQRQNLTIALQSSRQIGTAMGILMTHRKVTEEQAFTMLRTASQHLHRKLRDVAAVVAETGALPDVPQVAREVAASSPAATSPAGASA